jgi:hypothetical protein
LERCRQTRTHRYAGNVGSLRSGIVTERQTAGVASVGLPR